MYHTYTGGEAPSITIMQNTQASPEFLTLPQVIPTSILIPIFLMFFFPFLGGHFIGKSLSGTGEALSMMDWN